MSFSNLSDINPSSKKWVLCVRISRLWHHRGPVDIGPIKHTDMVLLDAQANHMYAEISSNDVDTFKDILQEGGVYEIRKFIVSSPKQVFKPVEASYMIRFTRFTAVKPREDLVPHYPRWTYNLTSFANLPMPTDMPARFTDVIGSVVSVSEAVNYQMANRTVPSLRREIVLRDMSGHEITVILWGERAESFPGAEIRSKGQEEPVVAIFVGTLVKNFQGGRGLGGTTACRWYINEEIPDITVMLLDLHQSFEPIAESTINVPRALQPAALAQLEDRSILDLVTMDVFDTEAENFSAVVTITSIANDKKWWFLSCKRCHKSAVPHGSVYQCSDPDCPCDDADPRYRICLVGTDGTEETEFVLFGRIGEHLIGKPIMSLLRSGLSTRYTAFEVIAAARRQATFPIEIASLVSKKFRFIVSLTKQSFLRQKPSFQVNRIDTFFGQQLQTPAFHPLTGPGSSNSPFGKSPVPPTKINSAVRQLLAMAPPPNIDTPPHTTPPHSRTPVISAGPDNEEHHTLPSHPAPSRNNQAGLSPTRKTGDPNKNVKRKLQFDDSLGDDVDLLHSLSHNAEQLPEETELSNVPPPIPSVDSTVTDHLGPQSHDPSDASPSSANDLSKNTSKPHSGKRSSASGGKKSK